MKTHIRLFLLMQCILFCSIQNKANAQCIIDYSKYHIVFEDEFNNYEEVSNMFSGTNPQWAYTYRWGEWFKTISQTCPDNVDYDVWSVTRMENISLIPDPHDPNDKCVALGYQTHNPPLSVWHPGDNAYRDVYKSGAVLRPIYEDEDGDCEDLKGFKQGIFEIRCKIPSTVGYLSAFWFWSGMYDDACGRTDVCSSSQNNETMQDNCYGWEVDVFEAMNKSWNPTCVNSHYLGDPFNQYDQWFVNAIQPNADNNGNVYIEPYNFMFDQEGQASGLYENRITDEFHTFTYVWTPDGMTIFIDGKEVRTDYNFSMTVHGYVKGVPQMEMDLLLSTIMQYLDGYDPTHTSIIDPDNGYINMMGTPCQPDGELVFNAPDDPLIVDYVRVYKPNNREEEGGWDYKTGVAMGNEPLKVKDYVNTVNNSNANIKHFFDGTYDNYYYLDYFSPPRRWLCYVINDGSPSHVQTSSYNVQPNTEIELDQNGNVFYINTSSEIEYYDRSSNTSTVLTGTGNVEGDLTWNSSCDRLYYRGTGNELCFFDLAGWTQVQTGYTDVAGPMQAFAPSNDLRVYYRTTSDEIACYFYHGGSESPWVITDPFNSYTADGSIAVTPGGGVFFKNPSNELQKLAYFGGQWNVVNTEVTNVASDIYALSDFNVYYVATPAHGGQVKQCLLNTESGHWMTSNANHFMEDYGTAKKFAVNTQGNSMSFSDGNDDLFLVLEGECEREPLRFLRNGETTCDYSVTYNNRMLANIDLGKKNSDLSLIPNPFNDKLILSSGIKGTFEIEIYNSMGQLVNKSQQADMIDSSNWPSGIYYYLISNGSSKNSGKIIKQ